MKQKLLFKSFMLALAALLCTLPMYAQSMVSNDNEDGANKVAQGTTRAYRDGQVIVKFKDSSPVTIKKVNGKFRTSGVSAVDQLMTKLGVTQAEQLMPLTGEIKNRGPRRAKALSGRIVEEPNLSGLYCLCYDCDTIPVGEVVEKLKELDEVEYAEPNYLVFIQSTEDSSVYQAEPMFSQQWGLNAIKMPQLWAMDKTDTTRPIIAILDTGVDITHPDLADNIWTNAREAGGANYEDDDNNGFVDDVHGWDFIAGTAIIGNGMDRNGHGTHCAGIAAAVGNNDMGITGANPDALILPIKVMDDDGAGDIATICRGIDYATACGAHVLSMSLGFSSPSYAMYQSLSKALTNYAILIAAAGNNGKCIYDRSMESGLSFPGAYDIVLGVMASDANGYLAGFSNYDPDGPIFSKYNMDKAFSADVTWNDEAQWNYDVMAPGVGIVSTYLNGTYKSLNGTSMATPMVAGAVSRILQVKGYDYARDYGLMGDMAMAKNGGITNFADFNAFQAASFDEANRQVALALTALEIDDSEGDGDGRYDAGETINIYPTIRSLWGHAENIKIAIEPYDENTPTDAIEVLDNNVDFGWSLNSRGSFKSKNPIRVHVSENAYDGMSLPYKVVITSDNLLAGVEQEHVFKVENGIEIGGAINEDVTLYPNKHYVVKKNIAIPQGKTLTILPGTRIEFEPDCYIQSEGKLIANGKPDSLIVFTSRDPDRSWGGIRSHSSMGSFHVLNINNHVYTNSDTTLFTLAPTNVTPIELSTFNGRWYFPEEYTGKWNWYFADYLEDFHKELWGLDNYIWMNDKQDLMTDPEFITPPLQQMFAEIRNALPADPSNVYTPECPYSGIATISFVHNRFMISDSPCDTLSYCVLEHVSVGYTKPYIYLKDCVIDVKESPYIFSHTQRDGTFIDGIRNNFVNSPSSSSILDYKIGYTLRHSNYVNFLCDTHSSECWLYSQLPSSNLINSGLLVKNWDNNLNKYVETLYMVGRDEGVTTDHAEFPSWLGTGKEEIIRPFIYDSKNPNVDCFTTVDLSNMPTRPYSEAHGIVWKVVVDGYDAQDEFDQLPPLGVGRHEFKVYFNRPEMDRTSTPQISMGLREPYTQTAIAEDGSWSVDDGVAVYTAYLTITGKTNADGLNRIYVTGAKDDEFFDVPDEKWRFNVLVQAAGSMATGFAAEAGMGKVDLTWNNENNDFEDAMGFNVYRFQLSEENDTINRVRLNETILDIEATEFTDYEVTPGTTYYYYYKVLSTDLKEYDISNVVAATPQTSTLGDANGSGDVDVADVITTVNYAAGMEPKPFIFGAADVNADDDINILDVIGIIRIITNPNAGVSALAENSAIYSVKDGVVYVDSPVSLAGVQVSLSAGSTAEITSTGEMKGFEQVSAWPSENEYLFLAYSMGGRTLSAGKHAILNIGETQISDIRLADSYGRNVLAIPADEVVSGIVTPLQDVKSSVKGIYDLMGRKVAGSAGELNHLAPGIYIVDGIKVVKY